MQLASKPTSNVTLDINSLLPFGTIDSYVNLALGAPCSPLDPGCFAATPPFGSTAGSYQVTFTPSTWNVPIVIAVSAAPQFQPFDPHNEFITAVVDPSTADQGYNPAGGTPVNTTTARCSSRSSPARRRRALSRRRRT